MKLVKWMVAAACAVAAASSYAQPSIQEGGWNCVVGGKEVQMTIAGDTATMAFAGGDTYTMKRDPNRNKPFYTDGKVALRLSGGGAMSTGGPEWVQGGNATTLLRCVPVR